MMRIDGTKFREGVLNEEAWKYLVSSTLPNYDRLKVYGAPELEVVRKRRDTAATNWVPHDDIYYSCEGYYTATNSTTSSSNYYFRNVNYNGDENSCDISSGRFGLCPVVVIPSDVEIYKDENGVWQLKQN